VGIPSLNGFDQQKELLMLVLLSLIAEQTRRADAHMAQLVSAGELSEAVMYGKRVLDSHQSSVAVCQRAWVGRLVGGCLLVLGREVEAEELFQRQHKLYSQLSCQDVRLLASMDQSLMMLSLRRLGRAAQSASSVIDDVDAAPALRVEALACLAECLYQLGEFESANAAIEQARELANEHGLVAMEHAVGLLALDQQVRQLTQPSTAGGNRALCLSQGDHFCSCDTTVAGLRQPLVSAARWFDDQDLLAHRVQQLLALLDAASGQTSAASALLDALKWAHDRRMQASEDRLRIQAALACISGRLDAAASDFVKAMVGDDNRIKGHRYAAELHYCAASLHEAGGRLAQALTSYIEHAAEATGLLRLELSRVRVPRCLADRRESKSSGADVLRLPPRYRAAHRYMMENLADSSLNVARVAAHAGVTPRMLQMVFREHLGITPAALIRTQRMERIQQDIVASLHGQPVQQVAAKWGIMNRSTITRGLRTSAALMA
jgi:AraC-like DNA-binding protein